MRVMIEKPRGWTLKKGESVAVQGICSTVVETRVGAFVVEYMPETLVTTTARLFVKGMPVNLERSLRFGGCVEGHFVQGHVEARSRVMRTQAKGASREITIAIPQPLMRFIAPKGSIAIDGVSLTVAQKGARSVMVAIIPHTLRTTTLGALSKGDFVNIETDMLARQLVAAR